MPFESQAQRRFMYATDPKMARRFEKKTKKKKLPEKVKKSPMDLVMQLLKYQDYEILEDDADPGKQRYTNLKVSPLRAFDHYLDYPIEGSISEAEAIRDAIDSPTEQAILDATRQSLDEQGQVDFDNRIGYYEGSEDPEKPPYSDKVFRRRQISPEGTSTIMPHEFQVAHHDKNLPPIIPYESKAEGYWPGGIHPYDDPSTWYDDEDDGVNPLERLQRISDMGIQGAKDFEQKNASEPMDIAFQLLKDATHSHDFEDTDDDVQEYFDTEIRPLVLNPKTPRPFAMMSHKILQDKIKPFSVEGIQPDEEMSDLLDEYNFRYVENDPEMRGSPVSNRGFSREFQDANKSEPMDLAMRMLKF